MHVFMHIAATDAARVLPTSPLQAAALVVAAAAPVSVV